MLRSLHEHSNKRHPEDVLLHSGPGDSGHQFISHHSSGFLGMSSKLVFAAFFVSHLEITSFHQESTWDVVKMGVGIGLLRSFGLYLQ